MICSCNSAKISSMFRLPKTAIENCIQLHINIEKWRGSGSSCVRAKKTGFIGFLAAIKSVQGTFQDLVAYCQHRLKCLLTYKLSQDHLELFFLLSVQLVVSIIIQRHSNLWLLTRGYSSKAQLKVDNTTILDIVGDACKASSGKTVTISEAALIRKYDLQERPPAQNRS